MLLSHQLSIVNHYFDMISNSNTCTFSYILFNQITILQSKQRKKWVTQKVEHSILCIMVNINFPKTPNQPLSTIVSLPSPFGWFHLWTQVNVVHCTVCNNKIGGTRKAENMSVWHNSLTISDLQSWNIHLSSIKVQR